MKKDVMIFIKGTQEVDGEKDTIELMTKGRYYKRRDVLYLSYDEMDEEDTEPTLLSPSILRRVFMVGSVSSSSISS